MVMALIGNGRQSVRMNDQPAQELCGEIGAIGHDALRIVAVVPNIQLGPTRAWCNAGVPAQLAAATVLCP